MFGFKVDGTDFHVRLGSATNHHTTILWSSLKRIGAIETGTEQRRLQQPKSSASDVDLNGSACLPPPKKKDGLLAYLRFEGG